MYLGVVWEAGGRAWCQACCEHAPQVLCVVDALELEHARRHQRHAKARSSRRIYTIVHVCAQRCAPTPQHLPHGLSCSSYQGVAPERHVAPFSRGAHASCSLIQRSFVSALTRADHDVQRVPDAHHVSGPVLGQAAARRRALRHDSGGGQTLATDMLVRPHKQHVQKALAPQEQGGEHDVSWAKFPHGCLCAGISAPVGAGLGGSPPEVMLVFPTGQAANGVPRQVARLQLLDADRPQSRVQAALVSHGHRDQAARGAAKWNYSTHGKPLGNSMDSAHLHDGKQVLVMWPAVRLDAAVDPACGPVRGLLKPAGAAAQLHAVVPADTSGRACGAQHDVLCCMLDGWLPLWAGVHAGDHVVQRHDDVSTCAPTTSCEWHTGS